MNKISTPEIIKKYQTSRIALYHVTSAGFLKMEKDIRGGKAVNLYDEEAIAKIFKLRESHVDSILAGRVG